MLSLKLFGLDFRSLLTPSWLLNIDSDPTTGLTKACPSPTKEQKRLKKRYRVSGPPPLSDKEVIKRMEKGEFTSWAQIEEARYRGRFRPMVPYWCVLRQLISIWHC